MAVVARGNVRDRPFARSIYAIAARRFTGDLILTQGGRSYRVAWNQGTIVGAVSPSPADSAGRVALTAGLVTSTQLSDAMRIANATAGMSKLDALAMIARLTPQQVLTIKRRAMAHRALRIFSLSDATFELDNASTIEPDPDLPVLSARWVIYHGVRTHYTEERLGADLAKVARAGFRLVPEHKPRLREYGFGTQASALVAELEHHAMTIDELDRAFPRMTRKAIMTLIYALVASDAAAAEQTAAGHKTEPDQPSPLAQAAASPPRPRRRATTSVPEIVEESVDKSGSRRVSVGHSIAQTRRRRATNPRRADQIRALIASKLEVLDSDADHFQLLGVPRGAPAKVIQSAYFELVKRLHPDVLQAAGVTEQADASHRLVSQINRAFAVLNNPKKRAEYEAELAGGGRRAIEKQQQDAEDFALRVIEAEKYFRRGEQAARRGQWAHALGDFQKAVELNPDEAENHAFLAWATWCHAADKDAVVDSVKQMFKRAITISPRSVAAYYFRGRVATDLGDLHQALDCFRKVLEFEPSHNDARVQVRLLESRLDRVDGKKKGLIDRIKRR